MPVLTTYPGVYIEEIPSGVHTITGVATSITAFIGRALRGPTNEPTTINSFGDFERRFGGLQEEYLMSYAVRDFYSNGGSQAIIVRLIHPNFATDADFMNAFSAAQTVSDAATNAASVAGATVNDVKVAADNANTTIQNDANKTPEEKAAAKAVADAVDAAAAIPSATLDTVKKAADTAVANAIPSNSLLRLPSSGDPLVLEAADEGTWGNALRARVDYEGLDQVGDRYKPLTKDDLFNLTIKDMNTGVTEQFLSVSVKDSPTRRVDRVLETGSNLVRVNGTLPAERPNETDAGLSDQDKKVIPFSAQDTKRSVGVADADLAGDGGNLTDNDLTEGEGLQDNKRGLYSLDKADLFNLLCIPADTRGGDTSSTVYGSALNYCVNRRAMLIVDSPAAWSANKETAAAQAKAGLPALNLTGEAARNAALYFPRVKEADPQRDAQLDTFVPCGIIAGVMARTDTNRGVWKAPAGLDAALSGIQALEVNLNELENGMLNPLGINCLRFFPVSGRVVWGARTLRGADQLADEYKYVSVRRLALYLEESLYRGTQWVVFEPNDEPLWSQIRLNVGAFMQDLFRQGAFQGKTPQEAYFVKCDGETTTQSDRDHGIVNILVGFAPLKPAEFVIIQIQQIAAQPAT